MDVVLDTNVFLSALITLDGPSGRVVDAWMRDRRYSLILSQPTLDEFERVLTRPKFGRLLRRTPDWLTNMQHEFRMGVTFVESTPVKVILQDPPDDLFLGTALAGAA